MSRKPEDLPVEFDFGCFGLEHPGGRAPWSFHKVADAPRTRTGPK